jgi:ATP-binding cassette subfamily B protein
LFLSVCVVSYIIGSICEAFPQIINSGLRIRLRGKLQDKIAAYPYISFEDTQFLDRLNKAEEGRYNTVGLYYTVRQLCFFHMPYLLFVSVILSKINILITVGLWLIFIPVVVSHIVHIRLYTRLEDEVAPIRRMKNHFGDCIASRSYFKETRLYGTVSFFYMKYKDTLNRILDKNYRTDIKICRIDSVLKTVISVFYCGILLMMLMMLLKGELSVGTFIAITANIGTVFTMTEDLVYNKIGYISTQFGSICNYYDLITSDPPSNNTVSNVFGDILLKNVTFRYPYTEEDALKNISVKIKEGETVAVVGENGSGKSTLAKIMMGIIEPIEGDVYYGNENISKRIIFDNISAIFQNHEKYSITLLDNIIISDYNKDYSFNELDELCGKIGLQPMSDRFPQGYNTVLSREFHGVDVSGGEWQKIAIIRGIFRRHAYVFLDEPTAAIDPIEEMKLYSIFSDISKESTSVIITHRLGAARLADRIIVMKKGMLIEEGTHNELLKKGGEYSRLWNLQRQWYTR